MVLLLPINYYKAMHQNYSSRYNCHILVSFLYVTHAEFPVGGDVWTYFCCKTTDHVRPKVNK